MARSLPTGRDRDVRHAPRLLEPHRLEQVPGERRDLDRGTDAELRRDGDLWRLRHQGFSAHLRDLKGLADLAVLLARPGVDVHVIARPHEDLVKGFLGEANAVKK